MPGVQASLPGRRPKRSVLNRLRSPNSWVMLHDTDGFVRLPNERIIYTSPPRTSISLQPINSSAASERFSRASSIGRVHLTNQRVRLVSFPACFALVKLSERKLTLLLLDRLPTRRVNRTVPVLLRTSFKYIRHPRIRSFLRTQYMDGPSAASSRRWYPAFRCGHTAENDLQRRRRV
jgi:hypothetical protein